MVYVKFKNGQQRQPLNMIKLWLLICFQFIDGVNSFYEAGLFYKNIYDNWDHE